MNTAFSFLNLALGQEDSFGKVLAGSAGKNGKTLWKEAQGATRTEKFADFVRRSTEQVDRFDKAMSKASDVFDKGTLKALRKSGKTNKEYYNKLIDLLDTKNLSKEKVAEFLKSNGIDNVKESRGLFKKIKGLFTGNKAGTLTADKVATTASEKFTSAAAKNADDIAKGVAKSSKGIKGLFKSLKGKGGTIGIVLTVAFELPEIVKEFINGKGKDENGKSKGGHIKEGFKQVGRSGFNIAGFAGGAAAGAAIGSIIPVAGTAVGAIVGGLCGIVGGMLGGAVTSKIGEGLFGKSIADQKTEQAEAQQEAVAKMQLAQGYNPNMNGFNAVG